jgi:hypothetical protein
VRDGIVGNGGARRGETRWRRLCEEGTRAKSVFQFDVQGQAAKATHAGIPWLRFLRRKLASKVPFGPSTAGNPLPEPPSSARSIQPSGSTPSRSRIEPSTSTTLTALRRGCSRLIATAVSPAASSTS